MKRFHVHFEQDRRTADSRGPGCVLPDYDMFYGSASTIKTAKRYIKEIREEYAAREPRNFRIYDMEMERPYEAPIYQEA